MSPEIRDLLHDAAPPPRGTDIEAILDRSAQIGHRRWVAAVALSAVVVPLIAIGAVQLTGERDDGSVPLVPVPSPSESSPTASGARLDLGTVPVPARGEATSAVLDDGQPVIVTHVPDGSVHVLDIESPQDRGGFTHTLAWCASTRRLVDANTGAQYDLRGDPASAQARSSAWAYQTEPAGDGTVQVYGPRTFRRDVAPAVAGLACPEALTAMHPEGSATLADALATPAGRVTRFVGVVAVDEHANAVLCAQVVAKRCSDDQGRAMAGIPVAVAPSSDNNKQVVAGLFLARRTAEGFSRLVRATTVDLRPAPREVGYLYEMTKAGSPQTEEGYRISYDSAELLSGDPATQHAYDTGGEVPVPNDYVIRNPDRVRTETRTDDFTLYLLFKGDPAGTPREVPAEEFRKVVVSRAPLLVEVTYRESPTSVGSLAEIFVP